MKPPRTAVTIGTFDGVHRGHAAILAEARRLAGPEGRVVALAFDPHPISVLRPQITPPRLTPFESRAQRLRDAGADDVRRLEPDGALLALTPEQFMRFVTQSFAPDVVVEGADFHFGRGRAGDVRALADLGRTLGFTLAVVPAVDVELSDQTLHRASSTLARWLLDRGRVRDAAAVLGRPYELTGDVRRGDRRGRTIGFPTINLRPETMLPAEGVYAGLAHLPNGQTLPAAINIGERPTVGGVEHRVEAHLLGLPTSARASSALDAAPAWAPVPGLPEYGWTARIELCARLRDTVRFGSLAELAAQLSRDCARIPAALAAAEDWLHHTRPAALEALA